MKNNFIDENLDKICRPNSSTYTFIQEEPEIESSQYKCWFYVLQLYPEDAPHIIKLGKTANSVEERSRKFYTWNPEILLKFPIKENYEKAIIAMMGKDHKQIGDELFVVDNFEEFVLKSRMISQLFPINDEEDD